MELKGINQVLSYANAQQAMFTNAVRDMSGYKTKTTFWLDFSIADVVEKEKGVRDTYKRAFKAWKNNVEYLTELSLVLNHKIWYWYEKGNQELAKVYDELWKKTQDYAYSHLKGKELSYYCETLD